MKLLTTKLMLLVSICAGLTGCFSAPGRSAGSDTHIPVQWWIRLHMPAGVTTTESVRLRLLVDGQLAFQKSVPLADGDFKEELLLTEGLHTIVAEAVGICSTQFALQPKPGDEVHLWLNRKATEEGTSGGAARYSMLYELRDDSELPIHNLRASQNLSELNTTVPLYVDFLGKDLGGNVDSKDVKVDVPFRIRIDGILVFDGIARAGNMVAANFIYRLKPGRHSIELEVPGEAAKSCVVDIHDPTSIAVEFWRDPARPTLHLTISNDTIAIF